METGPVKNNNVGKPNQNPTENVQSLRTYKSDVAEFIKHEGKTLADIAIAENSRQSSILKEESNLPKDRKKVLYLIGAVIILVIITLGIFWLILKSTKASPAISADGQIISSMFVSGIKEKVVSVGNQNVIFSEIDTALKDSYPFLTLQITSEKNSGQEVVITSREFLDKVGIYPPGDLVRSLTDNFAIGSIGGKVRFLVLKNNYYGGAFAGMLGFENTMVDDFRDLLNLPAIKSSAGINPISSTTVQSDQIKYSQFRDGIVANRDARIFKDGFGATILLYLFPDNDTIIIASSENTAKIVSEKLLRTKVR